MTIALPLYRGVSTKFAGRSFQLVTRWGYNPWLARVDHSDRSSFKQGQLQSPSSSHSQRFLTSKRYATTAAAHTAGRSRATATRATTAKTTTKKSTKTRAKKPSPKTVAGKSRVGRKPKTKSTSKKVTETPKPNIKKPLSKAAVTRKRIADERALKEKALLDGPKLSPATPWQLIFAEHHKQNQSLADSQNSTKQAAQKLKNLTPEEKEHYNHEANLAKKKNKEAHTKWLSQFTPDQIREANNARVQLKKLDLAKYPNRKHQSQKYSPLKDERLVRQPASSFIYFAKERHASGDFVGMKVPEISKLIGREWKALDDKKPYEDQAQADANRYVEEYRSVYGKHPPSMKKTSS